MYISKYRNTFLVVAGVIMALAIFSTFFFGLRQGIEFTGGTAIEVSVVGDVNRSDLESLIGGELSEGAASVQALGEAGYIIRTPFLSNEERAGITEALDVLDGVTVEQLNSVGPTIGAELQQKSIIAVVLVTISIVLFIAFAFRQVSRLISSWAYGGATILSQLFDLIFTVGAFALFGALFGAEVDSLFIIALLTVLGYSVNDTIIVFDRIRENLKNNAEANIKEDFDTTAGKSVSQTITRSIITSLTTSLALIALYFFGGEPTRVFSLTLLVGVVSGTYSSIFFGTPLLLLFNQMKKEPTKNSAPST